METLKSQNIALDEKEARRLDRASTDGKIPRSIMMMMTIMMMMVMMTMMMTIMTIMMIVIISGRTLLTTPKGAGL